MSGAATPVPALSLPDPATIPVALYVHMPWCVRKCPYCDFNSHASPGGPDEDRYLDALLRDLAYEGERLGRRPVCSLFIGGGTPSLFSGAAIARLLDGVTAQLSLAADLEVTLEANPGAAEVRHLRDYRAAGVNRLSIGVQSLDDRRLAALGRIHSADEALAAYRLARAAGFDNINLDLMYALPQQSPAAALRDLDQALALQPEHLSWYQLTLEPNTPFHHRPPPLPDDDTVAEIMDQGLARLAEAGYRRYEISAFARPGRACRHNLNYWEFGDYLGIGAGAHGKLSIAGGDIVRRSKRRHPTDYMNDLDRGAVSAERVLGGDDLPVEFMLNALRLVDGVPADYFGARTGLPLAAVDAELQRARRRGLLDPDPDVLRPTALGLRFLNELLAEFEPG